MLISFSGAQCTGKSTLLAEAQTLPELEGFEFVTEVTRRVKRTHGVAINDDVDNFNRTQRLIIGDHMANVCLKNAVLDRCMLDGMVYTHYFWQHHKVNAKVQQLAVDMFQMAMHYYDLIFVTDHNIPLVDDGERSVDTKFRNEIIDLFKLYREMHPSYEEKIVDLKGSVDERMKILKTTLKEKL